MMWYADTAFCFGAQDPSSDLMSCVEGHSGAGGIWLPSAEGAYKVFQVLLDPVSSAIKILLRRRRKFTWTVPLTGDRRRALGSRDSSALCGKHRSRQAVPSASGTLLPQRPSVI